MLGQSKTIFQAEIDAACEIVDFFRFNVHYGAGTARRAADQRPHDVESGRVSRPRGIRLRGHAVQFHVDCRQPAERAGADGQRRRLETGVERDVLGVLPDEAVRSSGHAAWRHQLRSRRRGGDLQRGPRPSRPGRRPFHRQHRSLQQHVEDDRRVDGRLSLVSAHRRRNRRQGFHHRASIGRSRGARRRGRARRRSSSRDRSARPPAACTCRARCGPTSASRWSR